MGPSHALQVTRLTYLFSSPTFTNPVAFLCADDLRDAFVSPLLRVDVQHGQKGELGVPLMSRWCPVGVPSESRRMCEEQTNNRLNNRVNNG